MPRTKTVNEVRSAPDLPPPGTRIEIVVQPDGSWVASVTVPLDGSVHLRPVQPAELNATKQTRVATAAENLYDAAMLAMGYTTA
jgi:hypothetical protein